MYLAKEISSILGCDVSKVTILDAKISRLSLDTRNVDNAEETIFFAMSGSMHDGHDYIEEALELGIKNIVASIQPLIENSNYNLFLVSDVKLALQRLGGYHRDQFNDLKVIGITGSNGKTTIKEWLYQMIQDRQVVKSPKSYNSQTGVPLSLWQIKKGDELGIFEAGISQINEMESLAKMIKPNIGLFTMIGDAHAEGFASMSEKLNQKLLLFASADTIIFKEDDLIVSMAIREKYDKKKLLSWGKSENSSLFRVLEIASTSGQTKVNILFQNKKYNLNIPFSDMASIENAISCTAVMCALGIDIELISERLLKLQNIPMRLEMKTGIKGSILINDSYNADIQSFKIALEFLSQQSGTKEKILILSDFMQTGLSEDSLNHQLATLIHAHQISHVIGVGQKVRSLEKFLDPFILFTSYENTISLLKKIHQIRITDRAILIKGARVFELEKVIQSLSDKAHTATLETDLQAMEHNLKEFSEFLAPGTQVIAVIKASAYGSGSEELARFLEFKKVGYLAVAFIDEGIQLRQAGVKLPIIILNPDRNGLEDMITFKLEPEVYSLEQFREIVSGIEASDHHNFKVHLKIDTGMHRLGFLEVDLEELCSLLISQQHIKVKSIFSHLSSSEDPADDAFTHEQVAKLNICFQFIEDKIGYRPSKHVLNSSGIIRFPEYHFDFVRLGLGLYGIDSTNTVVGSLEKVHTLKATIVQIKDIKSTDFIGYNRKGKPTKSGKIAIINIGYADGLMRLAGNGKYSVQIHDRDYPIIGNVCMDLTIIDIGNGDGIYVGDDVIIFGKNKPVEKLAKVCQTIPYEVLSRISWRVRRLYVQG